MCTSDVVWCNSLHVLTPPESLFFFNDTATTEIYTLSLHDALPISSQVEGRPEDWPMRAVPMLAAYRCALARAVKARNVLLPVSRADHQARPRGHAKTRRMRIAL